MVGHETRAKKVQVKRRTLEASSEELGSCALPSVPAFNAKRHGLGFLRRVLEKEHRSQRPKWVREFFILSGG